MLCPRTTHAAVPETNNKETLHIGLSCGYSMGTRLLPRLSWRFWAPGEPSRRRRVPKLGLVAPAHHVYSVRQLSSLPNLHARTRTHSVPQRAPSSSGQCLPRDAILAGFIAREPSNPLWRGWQRTPGRRRGRLAHRATGTARGLRSLPVPQSTLADKPLPAKIGPVRPPLPIPSATRPSTQRAPPQPPRALADKPQR